MRSVHRWLPYAARFLGQIQSARSDETFQSSITAGNTQDGAATNKTKYGERKLREVPFCTENHRNRCSLLASRAVIWVQQLFVEAQGSSLSSEEVISSCPVHRFSCVIKCKRLPWLEVGSYYSSHSVGG